MSRHAVRILAALSIAAVAIPLSGCIALSIPDGPAPAPVATDPVETDAPLVDEPIDDEGGEAAGTSLTFLDGLSLSSTTHIEWGDGLMADDNWTVESPDNGMGSWSYRNSTGACTATFWQGTLDGLESSGDDKIASDEVLGVVLKRSASEISPFATDGSFSYQSPGNLAVDNRFVTGNEGARTWIVAARGFAQVGVGMYLITDCTDGTADSVMNEVLGKNALIVM